MVKLAKTKNKKLEKLADKMLKKDDANQKLKGYDLGTDFFDNL